MPYSSLKELPESVRQVLPEHAQEIDQVVFNNAWDQYKDEEETVFDVHTSGQLQHSPLLRARRVL